MQPGEQSLRYLLAGRYWRLRLWCWGDPAAPLVLCLHGLTRNGRDFDFLARGLTDRFCVIAPDLPGRGGSDWLDDPALYRPESYVAALAHLTARFGGYDIVGTSLGGICGMAIAACPGNAVRRLVLNDIGPHIPAAALERIGGYVGAPMPLFADLEAAERYLRGVHAPFGPLSHAQWRHLATHAVRRLEDGGLTLHYDPAIAVNVASGVAREADMWPWWAAITAPTLTLRGEASDILPAGTLTRMAAKSATLTVADTGHAPALMDAATIGAIRDFLLRA